MVLIMIVLRVVLYILPRLGFRSNQKASTRCRRAEKMPKDWDIPHNSPYYQMRKDIAIHEDRGHRHSCEHDSDPFSTTGALQYSQ